MKVSIITPYFEGKEYMSAYVEMIFKNIENLGAGHSLEVILVNDSPWLKAEVGPKGEGIFKIITNEQNVGIQKSRINGLEAASGDYVIFLDQDDLLADDAVASFIEKAEKTKASVLVSNVAFETKNGTNLWYRTDYHKALVGDLKTYLTVGTQILSPGQCLIKKDVIPTAWKENICTKNGADDYYLWLLFLAAGVEFAYLDKPLYVHKYTEKNISNDTTVTDASCFEFIEFLKADRSQMKSKDVKTLETMLRYKADFRKAGKAGKLGLCVCHPYLFLCNLRFKIKTKTSYGFNR